MTLSKQNVARFLHKEVVSRLPDVLQDQLIYRFVTAPFTLPAELTFKEVQTEAEYQETVRLRYDVYIDEGYIHRADDQKWICRHDKLPTTHILIAKWQDEIIGTMTVIGHNRLGYPLGEYFPLGDLDHERSAEVSSLMIKKSFRHQLGGTVFFPFMKYMFECCWKHWDIDYLMVAAVAKQFKFYRSLMFFDKISVENYTYGTGVVLTGGWVNIDESRKKLKQRYGTRPGAHNLYNYFFETEFDNFEYPRP